MSTPPLPVVADVVAIEEIRNLNINTNLYDFKYVNGVTNSSYLLQWSDYLSYVFYFIGIIVIIIWVLMMVVVGNLSYARRLGNRHQEECGFEYMERETGRYYVYKIYTDMDKTFKAINSLFVLIIFIYVVLILKYYSNVVSILNSVLYNMHSNGFKIESTSNFMLNYFFIRILFIVLGVIIFSLLLTYIGSQWAAKKYHDLSTIDKSASSGVYWTTFSLIMIPSIIMYIYLTYYCGIKVNSGLLLTIALVLVYVVAYLLNARLHDFSKNAIVQYSNISNAINVDISNKLTLENNDSGELRTYLIRNIKRSFPNLRGNPKIEDYRSDYYSFLVHADGKETIGDVDRVNSYSVIDVKKLLNKANTVVLESSNQTNIFNTNVGLLSNVVVVNETSTSDTTFQTGNFNMMIRKDLVDIIYGEVFVKTESINGYLSKEYITNVINSYQTTTDSNNKIPDKTKVINLFVDNDYTIFNDKNANINGTYNLNSCMSILESAYEMDFIKNNDTVNDIINCFLWKMTSVDQRTVSLKNIKDALSNRKENYSYYGDKTYYKVLNNLEKALDTYMKNQNNANLQTHMASLRNIDQRMKDNANNIITMVFIFSYIFVVIILFIIYHIFYIMYEDEMQILLSASILLLIIAVTVYAWIIGNLK